MADLASLLCVFLPLLLIVFFFFFTASKKKSDSSSKVPKPLPIFGSYFDVRKNKHRYVQWTGEIVNSTPTSTFTLHRTLGQKQVITANPDNVHHVLKSHFHLYGKGDLMKMVLRDLLGNGIFNADGDVWKFQRQLASHEFNTKSLRKFTENVVDAELFDRLLPILRTAAANKTVVDLQDLLQRFAFDNICKIAFGYDPEYLTPSLQQAKFAVAFDKAVKISSDRFNSLVPFVWKLKRILNFGAERELKSAVAEVQNLAKEIIRRKKAKSSSSSSDEDLLSRFLSSGHSDEEFVMDIVISFTLAGRDTTSAALTWFFWLLSKNPQVEKNILEEVNVKVSESAAYEEVKELVYTHASISESMRLYPPVPTDTKCAVADDVLPDGTVVKKGTRVSYHPYAMGRSEKLWGADWSEYKPERWLEKAAGSGKLTFVNKDAYTYPVFQAGPRICLGKEMAFMQMKSVIAGILREFRVVPAAETGEEPIFISFLTAKMKSGFPVRFEAR
ncbi:hypothetical protein M569_02237, partial [Genlisea aurea]